MCHYDSVTNTVEEQLFLPVTTSYQVMKEDLGELAYQNNQEQFYLIACKTLYQIDLDSLKVTKKKEGFKGAEPIRCQQADATLHIKIAKDSF